MIHLMFACILSVIGMIFIDYYAKNYKYTKDTPVPISMLIAFIFMTAGEEISRFVEMIK